MAVKSRHVPHLNGAVAQVAAELQRAIHIVDRDTDLRLLGSISRHQTVPSRFTERRSRDDVVDGDPGG
jgi:6-phosphogluconolactonase (cycloisomerase 2 family)